MRIVTVRIDSRGQTMELKTTENYIGVSVSDYVIKELDNVIKEIKKSEFTNFLVIQLNVELGGEF